MSVIHLSKKTRLEPDAPVQKRRWAIHGVSELIGTFIIAFALSGLSIVMINGNPADFVFFHPIFLGFFEGFVVKGLLIIILIRWSVDINPAVTFYKIIIGYNTWWYGVFKISIQLLGGFLAGLLTLGLGTAYGSPDYINEAVTAERVMTNFYGDVNSIQSAALFLFFMELLLTMIYLFPIFSKGIHNEWRDLILMLILSMNTFLGYAAGLGAGSSNPARSLAIQIPGLLGDPSRVIGHNGSIEGFRAATWAIMFAGFFAPITFALTQDVLHAYINPAMHKAIRFKNIRVARISRDTASTSSKYNEMMVQFKKKSRKTKLRYNDPRYDERINT